MSIRCKIFILSLVLTLTMSNMKINFSYAGFNQVPEHTSPYQSDEDYEYLDKDTGENSLSVGDHFRSVWNQLRFGWVFNLPPNFTPGEPLHFLGRRYLDIKRQVKSIRYGAFDGDMTAFLHDFSSRLWFTYRDGFEPIPLPILHVAYSINTNTRNNYQPFTSTAAVRHRFFLGSSSFVPDDNGQYVCTPRLGSGAVDESCPNPRAKVHLSLRTSDAGWGCMLRSGQMLLAQALVLHFLGRDWTYSKHKMLSNAWYHRQIIHWFGDSLSPTCPFSVHRLVQASGSPPGSCLGPATLCRSLVITMAIAGRLNPLLAEMEVYLARDRVICSEEVLDLLSNGSRPDKSGCPLPDHAGNYSLNGTCPVERQSSEESVLSLPSPLSCSRRLSVTSLSSMGSFLMVGPAPDVVVSGASSIISSRLPLPPPPPSQTVQHGPGRGLILLIPMRLGAGSRIEPIYTPTFMRLLRDPACIGVVGGRPRHSVYIAGSQKDRLIYLDPHFCQDVVDVDEENFKLHTWHCSTPRLIRIKELDPSCAFGFYCRSRPELLQLLERLPRVSELRSATSAHRVNTQLIEVISASEADQLFAPLASSDPHLFTSSSSSSSPPSLYTASKLPPTVLRTAYPPIDDT